MPQNLDSLGLNFIVGLEHVDLSAQEKKLLKKLRPAGIILFSKNISPKPKDWIERLQRLIGEAQEACQREHLLVSIDHEGGRVHRLASPVSHFPYAREWRHCAFDVGRVMGRELRSLGVNLSFAPVLDIHSEEDNPVIGPRAFASDPDEVAASAVAFTQGLESQGVLSCGKHFPGHGATLADSHFELPVLEEPLELLGSRELIPFAAYVENDGPLIMTAHVHYPALDPKFPATISHNIITTLLRERMGFKGAIISDDLEMAALQSIPAGERAVLSLEAGVDILLEGNAKDKAVLPAALDMASGVLEALDKGRLSESLLKASQSRISALLDYSKAINAQSESADYPLSVLGCEEHQKLLSRITSD